MRQRIVITVFSTQPVKSEQRDRIFTYLEAIPSLVNTSGYIEYNENYPIESGLYVSTYLYSLNEMCDCPALVIINDGELTGHDYVDAMIRTHGGVPPIPDGQNNNSSVVQIVTISEVDISMIENHFVKARRGSLKLVVDEPIHSAITWVLINTQESLPRRAGLVLCEILMEHIGITQVPRLISFESTVLEKVSKFRHVNEYSFKHTHVNIGSFYYIITTPDNLKSPLLKELSNKGIDVIDRFTLESNGTTYIVYKLDETLPTT